MSRSITWALALVFALGGVFQPLGALPARAYNGGVVISQAYGGGGGSTGTYKYDYVELFNPGSGGANIEGWSLQYGSATGNFASTSINLFVFPAGTLIQPGTYLLVQLGAAGTGGVALPVTPDLSTTNLGMGAASGKVVLTTQGTALGCGATTVGGVLCDYSDPKFIDEVSWGTGSNAEGGQATNGGVGLTSVQGNVRKLGGCQDTNNNNADFSIVTAPSPRNSASAGRSCTLQISKTAPAGVAASGVLTYTLTITNSTFMPVPLAGVAITDVVPAGATYVPGSASNGGMLAGDVVTWTTTLAPGASASRKFAVLAPATTGTHVTNDNYGANASNWLTTTLGSPVDTIVNLPDLKVTKTGPTGYLDIGGVAVYTITYQNIGVGPATDVALVDTLPALLAFGSASDGGSFSNGKVTWNLGTVAAGETHSVVMTTTAALAGLDVNRATISGQPGDMNPSNNYSGLLVSVNGPGLYVRKTGPATLVGGLVVTYSVTFGNYGNRPAANVKLTDTLPISITTADIANDTSAALGLSHVDGSGFRTWSMPGDLAAASQMSFTLAITVPTNIPRSTAATNTVTIGSSTPGDDPVDSTSSTTGVIDQALTIGEVQGTGSASPYVGQTVLVRGVIYDVLITRSTAGNFSYGFFMQSKPGTEDGNPNTSDGIYVYEGSTHKVAGYTPVVGDEILLQANVSEYFNLTELASPFGMAVRLSGGNVIPPTEMMPGGAAASDTAREKWESMRMRIPAGSLVVAPTDYYSTYHDTEFFVVRGDSAPALRSGFDRRVFRDQHYMSVATPPTDEIQFMVSVEANVMKAKAVLGDPAYPANIAANYDATQLPAANTYYTITSDIVGPLYYAFSKFTIEPETAPAVAAGINPADNNPLPATDRAQQYSLMSFNVANLYDYLNNPNSNCDWATDTGCAAQYPGGSAANPPFDYIPASLADYQNKIQRLAGQVIGLLRAPDVIAVEEAEAQDICSGGGQIYGSCDTANAGAANTGSDGKLDVLQDLAAEIFGGYGISYEVANDYDAANKLPIGGDYRGIIVAYLYRTDRVELVPAAVLTNDPVLGNRPTDPEAGVFPHNQAVANPKALNARNPANTAQYLYDRPLLAALWRIHRTSLSDPVYVEIYTQANHFASGPDSRVQLRTDQANYNAAQVAALQAANPKVLAVVLGDLNVYPDGNTAFGADQLAALKAMMTNAYYSEPLEGRFSYSYNGVSQTLDQIFVTANLFSRMGLVRSVHINADFNYTLRNAASGLYNTSDHDPTIATFVLPWMNYLPLMAK